MWKWIGLTVATLGSVASAQTGTASQTVNFNMGVVRVISVTGAPNLSFSNADFVAGSSTSSAKATPTAGVNLFYSTNAASKITATASGIPNWVSRFDMLYYNGLTTIFQSLMNNSSATYSVNQGTTTTHNSSTSANGSVALQYLAGANLSIPAVASSGVSVNFTITAP